MIDRARIIVGGVLEKDGKYLLVQEAKKECYGKWNLPAGHLDPNETIFEGATREIFEESGFTTKLTGILGLFNRKIVDDTFIGIVFATEILKGTISFDKKEILDVKWFSYDEIINMKDELRSSEYIIDSINAHKNNEIAPLELIK